MGDKEMKSLLLNDIIHQINGRVLSGLDNFLIKKVMNLTKKDIKNNTLLFHRDRDSIMGKYWSENDFIAVVTDTPEQCTNLGDRITVIKVDDIEAAYWKFIDYYRNLFQIPVIGVTGTCGKTTTKEMIKQILEEDFNVEATWASMNSMSVNLRYLLDIDDETEMAVYEMPVCYPGYLQVACRYFQPQVRILLNIGVHHLADCDTPEAYMKAKAEMVDGLDSDHGILILNADDENIKKVVNITPFQNVIYFGKNEFSHFRAENIQYAEKGMNFNLKHNEQCYKVFIPGFGEHNVYNALAALAAVTSVGMDIETAIQRLVNFEHVEEHLEFKSGFNGCLVIDDTWNSSPLSMETGLQVLNDVSDQKFSIALLGYMPQLGEGVYAEQEYGKIGEKAVEYDLDLLFVVGKEAEKIGQRALEKGMDKNKVFFCETGAEIFKILKPYLNDQTIVLLKITHRVMKRPSFKALKRELIPDDDD